MHPTYFDLNLESRTIYVYTHTTHCLSDEGTGWRRLIGSPKLQIIFHKRATKYRSLLRKLTYKDKGSYESSPPCMRIIFANSMRSKGKKRDKRDLLIRQKRPTNKTKETCTRNKKDLRLGSCRKKVA